MPVIEQSRVGEYWQFADVLQQQFQNALYELEHWRDHDVYSVFVDVGRKLVAAGHTTLMDVGAGAGQYGMLWLGQCGGRKYLASNTDWVNEFYDMDAPIALTAAAIEYDQNPHAIISQWAEAKWSPMILHRLRFHDLPAAHIHEVSYFGAMVPMWRWNRDELSALLAGRNVERIIWPHNPNQETWVVT